jgi:hypothetical protein
MVTNRIGKKGGKHSAEIVQKNICELKLGPSHHVALNCTPTNLLQLPIQHTTEPSIQPLYTLYNTSFALNTSFTNGTLRTVRCL